MVTRGPLAEFANMGEHMLGYLKTTVNMALHYGSCDADRGGDSELAFPRSMLQLEVHSDASFGPAGGRGHQGLIAMYGGCPIHGNQNSRPFGTLSTSESELLGYTEAMVLGETSPQCWTSLKGTSCLRRATRCCMETINQVSDCLRARMGFGAPDTCASAVLF